MLGIDLTGWTTIVGAVASLVLLEGLLSADNALVLAVMVRHLPKPLQKRALRYGIIGAFLFRLIAVVFASQLLVYWQLKVFGGLYLLYLAIKHFAEGEDDDPEARAKVGAGFWMTVVNVEIADIAFSIDSILAAVAMAESLPPKVGNLIVGTLPGLGSVSMKLVIVYIGGILGIIAMRLVAGVFLVVLERFKGLAAGAYVLVAWIGLKLVGSGLHRWRSSWPTDMPEWLFWAGMGAIIVGSLVLSPKVTPPARAENGDGSAT